MFHILSFHIIFSIFYVPTRPADEAVEPQTNSAVLQLNECQGSSFIFMGENCSLVTKAALPSCSSSG